MCGRYALGIRAAFVRYQLQQQGMPVDEAPDDDAARETYNFPPGSFGLVYRADVPDHGIRDEEATDASSAPPAGSQTERQDVEDDEGDRPPASSQTKEKKEYKYQLKVMKWGLIPFWTKRSPDYGSMLRTINCRDDSLKENRGMWTSMKQRKRCIVIAQGFYEWLKKGPGGKEKIPHFVKRKDGQLMCFAGLWDCVKYEDAEEKTYSYTIITTDSNKQLKFLHDRMPVILDAGSEAMKVWLDPERNKWTKELQSLLKPYEGELECYPVSKDVGKVGNNSPDFIVPIDSKENKKNIANFFGNAKKANLSPEKEGKKEQEVKMEQEEKETTRTEDRDNTEDNAPMPVPAKKEKKEESKPGEKRKVDSDGRTEPAKVRKIEASPKKIQSPQSKSKVGVKTRSATSNVGSAIKASPTKKASDGSQRITNFFTK